MKRKRSPEDEEVEVSPSESGSQNDLMDQLIEVRKQEKRKALKEKLQQKLGIIRDRRTCRSEVNHEPFPEGVFERLKSNNVWEQVLGYLTDPTDVKDASVTCASFAGIMEKQRMRMMFPKALNVFKDNVEKSFYVSIRSGEEHYKLWKQICLNLRGLCKAWKDIADSNFFDSDFTNDDWLLLNTDWMDSVSMNGVRNETCVFSSVASVERAMSLVSPAVASPCLIRNVKIHLDVQMEMKPFVQKVIRFLKANGKAVWYFHFFWDSTTQDDGETFQWLCGMLERMPNLKGLRLIRKSEELENEAIQIEMPQHPFPPLPSLEHFNCAAVLNSSIFSQILGKCVNLKSIVHSPLQTLEITNEMTEAYNGLTLERYDGSFPILASSGIQVPWPLKKLTIMFWEYPLNASELFPVLNKFHHTLQYLRLWGTINMDTDTPSPSLDLPHLKEIFLVNISQGTINFDDLLPLKSLEEIIAIRVDHEDENAKVKVKRYLDLDKGLMLQSNVWQCFPNLLRFHVHVRTGTLRTTDVTE